MARMLTGPQKFNKKQMTILLGALLVLGLGAVYWFGSHAAGVCYRYQYGSGGSGSCVRDIQNLVNYDYYQLNSGSYLTADGQFGPKTKAVIQAYQTRRGLTADGIVGPNTWRILCSPGFGPPPAWWNSAWNDAGCQYVH